MVSHHNNPPTWKSRGQGRFGWLNGPLQGFELLASEPPNPPTFHIEHQDRPLKGISKTPFLGTGMIEVGSPMPEGLWKADLVRPR